MSDSEEFQSAMSFWNTLDNLATVNEDVVGEEIESTGEFVYPGWKFDSNGLIRLNSEGGEVEEIVEGAQLDEEYLTCLTGRMPEYHLFSEGVDFGEEYFESLSDLVGNKDQKCNFCKDIFKENLKLSEKVWYLEGKNICLQNIKRELIEQLGDVRAVTDTMEEEINQLRTNLVKAKKEKENLEVKMKKMENEVYCKAEPSPPPAPPPPPPKSFLSNLKLPFKKKTKRSVSMPENMNIIAKQGSMMSLSVAVLDAIKNKAYRLRPVEKKDIKKIKPNDDFAIGEILARRIAMGYREEDIMEEEGKDITESSLHSFKSNGTVYI